MYHIQHPDFWFSPCGCDRAAVGMGRTVAIGAGRTAAVGMRRVVVVGTGADRGYKVYVV